ncbi:hypothetical protein Ms3S1_31660 [Methylosinus sp. 3S-1]
MDLTVAAMDVWAQRLRAWFRSAPYRSKGNLYRGSRYTKSGDGPCLSTLFGTRPLTGAFDSASQAVSADMMWSVSRIEKASGVLPDLDLSQLLVERLWRSYVFSCQLGVEDIMTGRPVCHLKRPQSEKKLCGGRLSRWQFPRRPRALRPGGADARPVG